MQKNLIGTGDTAFLCPLHCALKRDVIGSKTVVIKKEKRCNSNRVVSQPYDRIRILGGQDIIGAAKSDQSIISKLPAFSLAARGNSPKLMVAGHPDDSLKTRQEKIEGKLQIRIFFCNITGQNKPVLLVTGNQ